MNVKTTAVTLLMMASLYGELSAAQEVVISQARLQSLGWQNLSLLIEEGIVRLENHQAILDINRLELLVDSYSRDGRRDEIEQIRFKSIPYGAT